MDGSIQHKLFFYSTVSDRLSFKDNCINSHIFHPLLKIFPILSSKVSEEVKHLLTKQRKAQILT